MIDGLKNGSFLINVETLAEAKERDPKNKLYMKRGTLVVTNQAPPNSQEIKFDALLDEAEKRSNISPLEKKNLANHIRVLDRIEARTWTKTLQRPISFIRNILAGTGQKEKSRVEQIVEKLDLSARNEAASSIQKAYRKFKTRKKAEPIKSDESPLQKIWRIIKSIFSSFLELFKWSPKVKRKNEMDSLVEEEVATPPTSINELKEVITKKINKEYASFLSNLGEKEGCPDFEPPIFENDTLVIRQPKASKLDFSYIVSGTASIPEELKMRYQMNGSKMTLILESEISVTAGIGWFQKNYIIDCFVLEKEKFSIVLKNESEERVIERPAKEIAGMLNILSWVS